MMPLHLTQQYIFKTFNIFYSQKRQVLEETNQLDPRLSALEDDLEDEDMDEDMEIEDVIPKRVSH